MLHLKALLRAVALGLAGLLILAGASARAAVPLAASPLRFDYGGWLTVAVTVNGEGPFDFIVDTGATQSIIFDTLQARLALPAAGTPPQRVLGISSIGEYPTFRVREIALGAARLTDVVTVVLPNWAPGAREPQGVLGLDFLQRHFIVFDRRKREMRLYAAREPGEATGRGWHSAGLTRRNFTLARSALYTVDGRANGSLARYIVDLGATGTIVNKANFNRIAGVSVIVDVGPGDARTGSRIMDALRNSSRQEGFIMKRFRIGGARWTDEQFTIYDAPIFEELGVLNEPYGLLGADLFFNRSFALDFRGGRIFIGPPGS
jgi:predicted aspartyl protease